MIDKLASFFLQTLKRGNILFLIVITSFFALLRFPSVAEPYWYGDEGVYEVIGIALRKGLILYRDIWDNKPPLLYVIYAIFNGDQFYVRLASLVVGLLSVVIFFFISRKLFKSNISVYIATAFFAVMFGAPIIEGNIANAENFMMLPTLASFYLLFCTLPREASAKWGSAPGSSKLKLAQFISRMWPLGLAGFVLSLSFLTKIVAVFDFAAFSISLLSLRFFDRISFKHKEIVKEIKKLILGIEQEIVFVIAFIIPIALTALYFISNEAFSDFLKAAFSQNVGYVGYGNFFIFPMGLLYLKVLLLIFGVLLTFHYRKILSKSGVVIVIWLLFSVANALFSQRPYTHYLLVALPALSLFLGYMLDNKKILKFSLPFLILVLIVLLNTFKLNFRKVIPYYLNYLSFVTGVKPTEDYQAFFDRRVPRDYKIADFIRLKTTDSENVFLWGDNPQIYALSGKLPPGRYTVSYHITFYKDAIAETKIALSKSSPRYIIQIKDSPDVYNFTEGYELRYKIEEVKIYERKY